MINESNVKVFDTFPTASVTLTHTSLYVPVDKVNVIVLSPIVAVVVVENVSLLVMFPPSSVVKTNEGVVFVEGVATCVFAVNTGDKVSMVNGNNVKVFEIFPW